MWKLFIFTFLYLILITSCTDDSSGDGKAAQIAAAAVQLGSSPDGNSASAVAVAELTSTGSGSNSESGGGSDEDSSEEDDDDNDCNVEELDDDYDCTSAMSSVQRAILKIGFIRENYYLKNNFANNNNYCNINQTQGNEGFVGSPLATWYGLSIIGKYAQKKTLYDVLKFLGLKNKDECQCVMRKMKESIKPFIKDYYVYSAVITADNEEPFSNLFKMDAKVDFGGTAFNSNFNASRPTAKKVNKYTAVKTGYLVKRVVSKKEASTVFNLDQNIVEVFSSYLTPVFKMSLNIASKSKGIYYGLNEPMLTEYFTQDVIYNCTESTILKALICEIELKIKQTKLVFLFPNTRCGLQSVVEKLAAEPQIFIDELKCLKRTRLCISFPVYKSFTYVENVVPALKSTCEIDRILDDTKAELVDSCGKPKNTSITYIHEKTTAIISPIGVEPYKKATAIDCPECGEPKDVRVNYSALYFYFVKDVAVEFVMGPVVNALNKMNE